MRRPAFVASLPSSSPARRSIGTAPALRTVGIAMSLVVLAACGGSGSPAADDAAAGDSAAASTADGDAAITFSAAQAQHGGVRWAPVTASEVATSIELPGQLVPNEDRTARLGAPAQGRVVTVHVRPGERVARGQALVTLQSQAASAVSTDYAKANAELASRRAAATYARTARERADRLLAIKAGSRQEAERAAADDELARAGLAQAEAEVARARAGMTQLGATASASGTMVVRSPIAGIVLSRDATPGAIAEAGAPLVTVSDPSSLWLEIAASDRAAGGLRTGARVQFTVPAFAADTFVARVQSVGGALDTATRTVPVRALVDNGAGRLRAAMFATTWIDGGERRLAVLVPDSAVQLLDNRAVVFVARPDGKGGARFERRDVEVGSTAGGQTQVLSGLRTGDTVVVAGAFAVKSEFARSKMAEG